MRKNGIVKVVSRMASAAVEIVMPMRCVNCDREGPYVCSSCEPSLPRLRGDRCRSCATPGPVGLCETCAVYRPAYDRIIARYLMEGAVRVAVHDLKYRNLRAAAPELGRLMAATVRESRIDADVVIPVPIHRKRERQRGYNQSQHLAAGVAKKLGLPVDSKVLRKLRDTEPQVSMPNDEERRSNLDGAFSCDGRLTGSSVLLIDDVVTTGSTISSCAEALKSSGASTVFGVALAREP